MISTADIPLSELKYCNIFVILSEAKNLKKSSGLRPPPFNKGGQDSLSFHSSEWHVNDLFMYSIFINERARKRAN